MSRRIWKFPLAIRSFQHVIAPKNAHAGVLSVQLRGEHPCMWAVVDDTEERKERIWIQIVGTGHEVPESCHSGNYLGTVQGDGLVWHVFMPKVEPVQ